MKRITLRVMLFSYFCIAPMAGCESERANTVSSIESEIPANQSAHPRSELKLELSCPAVALGTLFPEVIAGERSFQNSESLREVLIFYEVSGNECRLTTEALSLSIISDGSLMLSVQGVPESLEEAVGHGKAICTFFKSCIADQAAIDQWVTKHHSLIDKSLVLIRDVGGINFDLQIRNSFESEAPYRVVANIYFDIPGKTPRPNK